MIGIASGSCIKLDGHHIPFNVVDADTLRKAQNPPEQYKDLVVRVAATVIISAILEALYNEIIVRTEHKEFNM